MVFQISCFFLALQALSMFTKAEDLAVFGTKTPYELVQNLNTTIPKPDASCRPIHIDMVFRHGHRFPTDSSVEDIIKMSEKINMATSTENVNITLPWKNPFTEKEAAATLTTIGEKELYDIGARIRERFPELFTKKYTPVNYKFMSTDKLRTIHSTNSFASAIFDNTGSLGPRKLQPIAIDVDRKDPNDELLRFYDACPRYKLEVEDNKGALQEETKFQKGPEIEALINRIMTRLAIPDKYRLNFDDVHAIYISCAYEIGMFGGSLEKGICSLLNPLEDIPLLEYAADMEDYYLSSAGYNISYQISCPLLTDILERLTKASQSKTTYNGVFRAGHSSTILPIMALLGANVEPGAPLKADNYNAKRNRTFKTSKLAPFAANIYFVLYECGAGKKIQMYINEKLTKIPCCDSPTDCKFDVFVKCYEKIVQDCDFKKMCDVPMTPSTTILLTASNKNIIFSFIVLFTIFLTGD